MEFFLLQVDDGASASGGVLALEEIGGTGLIVF